MRHKRLIALQTPYALAAYEYNAAFYHKMKKITSLGFFVVVGILAGSITFAASPQISSVKFKATGESNKLVVVFDQPIQKVGGGTITPADFTLGGTSSTSITIANVESIGEMMSYRTFLLTLSGNTGDVSTTTLWTIAASSTLQNAGSEVATTTPTDLFGYADSAGPTILSAFIQNTQNISALFSEEVDTTSATTTGNYQNFVTSAVGDTPGLQNIFLTMGRRSMYANVSTSTTLGWGTGNSIDVGGVQDLVGNTMVTSTITILPPIKISEVKARSSSSEQDEFIELYNMADMSVTTTGIYLHIVNGATDTAKTLSRLTTSIPAHGYYLIGSKTGYSGNKGLDAEYDSSTFDIRATSSVYLSSTSSGPIWTQVAGGGVNSSWSGYRPTVLAVSGGNLYAGLYKAFGNYAEVWRYNGSSWAKVGGDGLNSSWPTDTYLIAGGLSDYDGNLYTGIGGGDGLGEVWKFNGTTWSQVGGDGLNSSWDAASSTSVVDLEVLGNNLLASVSNSALGPQVWGYNGTAWALLGGIGVNGSWATSSLDYIYDAISYGGKFYIAGGGGLGDDEVWEYNGVSWQKVGGDGVFSSWSDVTGVVEVSALAVANGKLYANVSRTGADAGIWEFNGAAWNKVSGDGLNGSWATGTNITVTTMIGVGNKLYAGLGLLLGNADVWEYNGFSWRQIGGTGLNGSWSSSDYSVESSAYYNGKIYMGLIEDKVWRFDPNDIIDLLGMGSAQLAETATTSALVTGKSYERKATDLSSASTLASGGSEQYKGNSQDTDNNANDFVLRDNPEPQNASDQAEFPFGGPGSEDSGAPYVMGTFPSGSAQEVVPTPLSFVGFNFSEPVKENTISTSSVLLLASGVGANLCERIEYTNFPQPGNPSGKCIVSDSGNLSSAITYTLRIATTVLDVASNTLNQVGHSGAGAGGIYEITFTPSSGGGGLTFQQPTVFVMGTMPFPGAVNIPRNISKILIKLSGNVATSTVSASTVKLQVVGGAEVSATSISTLATEEQYTSDAIIFVPSATLAANTEYELIVTGLQDTNSRTINSFNARFKTGASSDTTGPSVVGKLPSMSTGVPVNAIDIHVMTDDKLDPSTVASTTISVSQGGNTLPGKVMFDPFTGEIIFFANNVFAADTSYTVTVNATGTTPCVKNISALCLQDTDGTDDNVYAFSFTTGSADATGPQVMFANADQRNLSISFNEPVKESDAETFGNYSLVVGGATTTLSSLSGHQMYYNAMSRSVSIQNLSLTQGNTFSVEVSNVRDLSGNTVDASYDTAQGTVQDMSKTMGFVGPGGPAPGSAGFEGNQNPGNFSTSTFGFVPQIEVKPFSPMVGATTTYIVELPISQQVKATGGGGKIVLTFPTGFDVSQASPNTQDPMSGDVNGPGPGTITVLPLTIDATARTIQIDLGQNTRCDSGNTTPCSGDAHDFLHFAIQNITNSSIPKDGSSGGYTVDVKTMNGTTVLESLTSRAFYLVAGGNRAIKVVLTASGATSGNAAVRMFSPFTGPRQVTSGTFSAEGTTTAVFTGLVEGTYGIFTDPIVAIGGVDYMGQSMPIPVSTFGLEATTTVSMTLQSTGSLATVTVAVTGPTGKNIDVFAGGPAGFVKKATTTTGSAQSIVLKLPDGTWSIGVGPQIPDGPFSGPPPAPDFVMQPPTQVVITSGVVKENSGTANDGTIVITLSAAGQTLSGSVVDPQNRSIVGAEVFAYSPMGGFGTHGSTNSAGQFSLSIGPGMYQLGAFAKGLPPSPERSVEVRGDGTLLVNGQATSSIILKLIKPERTISGKVLDQSNNPVQNAGVFAYCDPGTASNACFGPGDHTGSPTGSDGAYTLYVKAGTWKIGSFLPGFGELPQVTKVVTSTDISDVNFSPSTATTFITLSQSVCRDADASGGCGAGEGVQGVFVRAYGSSGSNQTITGADGSYTMRVPANADYTIEAFDPAMGRLTPFTGVDLSVLAPPPGALDFVVGNPQVISIAAKDSTGAAIQVQELFVDLFDSTTKIGGTLRIQNATTGSISLPAGSYKVRASIRGKNLSSSALASNSGSTTFNATTSVLTVDGAEGMKVTLPALGIISGTVFHTASTSGNELSDAFVQFISPSDGAFFGVQANASGTYAMTLPQGTYKATAQKPGYFGIPTEVSIATTTTSTQNIIASAAALTISGTVSVDSTVASRAFVRAERLGGGFAGAQTGSDGTYSLSVANGIWKLYAVAEGYAETAYASNPIDVSGSSLTGKNFDLTTKVTLTAPQVCQITPSQGGECSSDLGNDGVIDVRVTVPPSAFGSDTSSGTLTIKETNTLQERSGTKPKGTGFDFNFVDSSGNTVSNFSSSVTLEFIQSTSTLIADGVNTKTKVDKLKVVLYSESIQDYDALLTNVDYLNAAQAVVSTPSEDLSNVAYVKFKALTSHFSGGGPGDGGDSVAPATPSAPTVSGGAGASAISVSWSAVTTNSDGSAIDDLSEYNVWRSTSQASGFAVIATTSSSTVSYSDSSAVVGTTYYYKISAKDTNSNESSLSSASAAVSRTTATTVTVSGGGSGGFIMTPSPTVVVSTTTTVTTTTTTTSTAATTTTATGTTESTAATQQNLGQLIQKQKQYQLVRGLIAALAGNLGINTETLAKVSAALMSLEQQLQQQIDSVQAALTAQGTPKSLTKACVNRPLDLRTTGDDVKNLQQVLKDAGYYNGPITGYFGTLTQKAIQALQSAKGIAKAGNAGFGYVGPKTRAVLNELFCK